MAETTHGTAHLYGITAGVAAVANATVLSFSLTSEHKNRSQTVNEIGNEIEDRYDDLHKTGSLTLRPRTGFTPLTAGSVYTYDSVTFIITSQGVEETSSGHKTVTYAIKTSEYITLA